jgi:phospholipase C
MTGPSPIERVVVLMLENHSFDHLLGWLPGVGALDDACSNPIDLVDPDATRISVGRGAAFCTAPGPDHSLAAVNVQLFGDAAPAADAWPALDGFVAQYAHPLPGADRPSGDPAHLMGCYLPDQLPVLSTLARRFVTCTRWFASVPGPTGPNRLFANCATSGGYAGDAWTFPQHGLPSRLATPTLFETLSAANRSWGIYYEDFATELCLDVVREPRFDGCRHHHFCDFFWDAAKGQLPDYCFLTPRLDGVAPGAKPPPGCRFPVAQGDPCLCQVGNSQHPPDDVRHGEELIARVYEAIRGNPRLWSSTLLVITYDEHGGFYDSVSPPGDVPAPDGGAWPGPPPFDFRRLGVRVPALLVSAWLDPAVDDARYEHASIPATVMRLFGLPGSLTARDAAANTFEHHLKRTAPRDDTPAIERPPWPPRG